MPFLRMIITLNLSLWLSSFQVLQELSRKDTRVKVVKLVRNFGSTNAQLAGIGFATGDAVVVISADLQDPPELIHDMLPPWKNGIRMVFAARNQRDDPLSTRLPAGFFNVMFRNFALKRYPKGGFDCFLIDRQVVNMVIQCAEKKTPTYRDYWSGPGLNISLSTITARSVNTVNRAGT